MPITTKPFVSQAQQAFAFGTHQPWAKRWADETDFSKLPKRVQRIRRRRVKGCTCGETTKEQLAPGVTRIRGNLCNVHGRYGPCDAAASGKKPKGGKGRKPKKSEQQREQERQAKRQQHQAERTAEQDANIDKTLTSVGIGDEAASTLLSLAAGEGGGGDDFGLIKQGLVERDTQGNLRLSGSGRVFLNAAKRGDLGAARDAISRGGDRAAGQAARASARQQRIAERAARKKKPKGGKGGKNPAAEAVAKPAAEGAAKPPTPAEQRAELLFQQRQQDRAERRARQQQNDAERTQRRSAADRRRETADARRVAADARRARSEARAAARAESAANRTPRRRKEMQTFKAGNPGDYLVVEDRTKPSTWHLQVKRNGTPDHGLMGGAWAALHGGYRGNKYAGPNKAEALSKLRALYAAEKMPLPSEKEAPVAGIAPGPAGYRSSAGHSPAPQAVVTVAEQALASSIPPSFQVFKDASGADRWVSISSTAYRDRDQEIVSTKALQGTVALADASGYRGPLRFWHVPGVEIGDCDFQATAQDGRFLIESGTFRSPALAAAVKERASGYQVSIGFTHPANEPDQNGVFSHIAIFERSLVPKGRAANPFTQVAAKEIRMLTTEKAAALKELLGGDQSLLDSLLGQVATTDKAAQESGVAYKDATPAWAISLVQRLDAIEARFKDTDKPEETAEKAAPAIDADAVDTAPEEKADGMDMADGMEPEGDENMLTDAEIQAIAQACAQACMEAMMPHLAIGQKMDEVKSMLGGMAGTYAKKDAELAEVKEQLKTVTEQVADLSGSQPRILSGGYRASQASATVTTDETKLKQAQPSADPVAQSFAGWLQDMGINAQQPAP